jgi:hypothetical protein
LRAGGPIGDSFLDAGARHHDWLASCLRIARRGEFCPV